MQTDAQFYEVFKRHPRALLRLAGLPTEGAWQMESVTVKATEKRMDGLLMRRDQEGPLVFAEFQGYVDKTIYYRLFRQVMRYYELTEDAPEPFVAILLFLHPSLDPGFEAIECRPPNRLIRLYLPECLEALENEPGPWAVFEPLVARDLAEVKAKGPAWRARIEGLKLPQSETILLMDCLVNFVNGRFPKLSFEEVLAMFQLTPFEQTRVGQQRFQQGLEQGLEQGLSKGLSKGREQGRQEGREQGLEQGLSRGEIIGRIRTYQELMGEEMSPVEALSQKSLRSLKGMATRLRNSLGQARLRDH